MPFCGYTSVTSSVRSIFNIRLGLNLMAGLMLASASAAIAAPDDELIRGRNLALAHCSACHLFPEPDVLPKRSWKFSLAYMGLFLGQETATVEDTLPIGTDEILATRKEFVETAGLRPAEKQISDADWATLKNYYLESAPDAAFPQIPHPAVDDSLPFFRVASHQYGPRQALTSLVHIDAERNQMILHDALLQRLTIMDQSGRIHASHPAPGVALVDVSLQGDEAWLLNIGDLFAARIGEGVGEIQRATLVGPDISGLQVPVSGLLRPTHLTHADLNRDGVPDFLVSNFGDYTGSLHLYWADPATHNPRLPATVLSEEPGIVATQVADFNNDGHADIAVLASQAFEALSILWGNGSDEFERQWIVNRHASWGYTTLKQADFNGDGWMDLITLNGDNGDSDPFNTLKRDQGIRIWLNQEGSGFAESYFYPMYGAFGAEIADFDADGDLDIAAVAFHPDFDADPPENFIFLEQTAPLEFLPRTHPATFAGRWMTITSGDLDGDEDIDIAIGAGYSPVGLRFDNPDRLEEMMRNGPALLIFENQLKD